MARTSARRILDVGCGSSILGKALKERQDCEVIGITHDLDEAAVARTQLDGVVVADLNDYDPGALGVFDCVICSHVLEHLYRPQELLRRLRPCLRGGELLVALPNVLFWRQRLVFLRGSFKYSPTGGLMDETHYRFFDWTTAHELLRLSGYRIVESHAGGYFPLSWILPPIRERLNQAALRWMPGFFGWQFCFRCVVETAN